MRTVLSILSILFIALSACGDEPIELQPGVYDGMAKYTRDTCQIYPPGHTQYTTLTWLGAGADGFSCSLIDDAWVCELYEPPIGDCRIEAYGSLTIEPVTETSMSVRQIIKLQSSLCAQYCELEIYADLNMRR